MLFGKGPEAKETINHKEESSQNISGSVDLVETKDVTPLTPEQQQQFEVSFLTIKNKLGEPHEMKALNSVSAPASIYHFNTSNKGTCLVEMIESDGIVTCYFDIDMDGDGNPERYLFITHAECPWEEKKPIVIDAMMQWPEDIVAHFKPFHDEAQITTLLNKITTIISPSSQNAIA